MGAYHRDPRVAGATYRKVAGIGLPITGIIVEDFVHLANVCDANGWKAGGVVFEPAIGSSSTRWQNLKDILAAGGATPCFRNGRLGLKVSAPRVALDTITEADLADDKIVVSSGLGWEERLNTLIPKYRSRDHKWEYVASTEPVSVPTFVAVDGEVKREERQFQAQRDHAAAVTAARADERLAANASSTIATTVAQQTVASAAVTHHIVENLRNAVQTIPPAAPGDPLPAAPVDSLRAELNAAIALANRAAEPATAPR